MVFAPGRNYLLKPKGNTKIQRKNDIKKCNSKPGLVELLSPREDLITNESVLS